MLKIEKDLLECKRCLKVTHIEDEERAVWYAQSEGETDYVSLIFDADGAPIVVGECEEHHAELLQEG